MSGSFSWMLVWYSAGEKAQSTVLSLALESLHPPPCSGSWDPQALFSLLTENLPHAQVEDGLSLIHK